MFERVEPNLAVFLALTVWWSANVPCKILLATLTYKISDFRNLHTHPFIVFVYILIIYFN